MNSVYSIIKELSDANKKNNINSDFPSYEFPPLMRDLIEALHDDSQIPIEIIGNTVLAAASMACQPLVNVALPHSIQPETCCLYLLTIAESGEGKTTINKQIMEPFHTFMSELNKDYVNRVAEYKVDLELWRLRKKVLERNVKSSYVNPDDEERESVEDMENAFILHLRNEPQKPERLTILYEDTTLKAFTDGVAVCSHAGIISDEAIIFFRGYASNQFGIFNKGWEEGEHVQKRADGTFIFIKPCITFSLMAQPKVVNHYFEKEGGLAKDVGFLPRFLFASAKSTIGSRTDNINFSRSRQCLENFHGRIRVLLSQQKESILNNTYEKKTLILSDKALEIRNQLKNEIEGKMVEGKELYHIRDIVSKSSANAARMAAIFHYFSNDRSSELGADYMASACNIMRWYLEQARKIFYTLSEDYQFEKDAKEIYVWVRNLFADNKFVPLKFEYFRRKAPNRLRNTSKLKVLFDQMVSQNYIVYGYNRPAGAMYVLPSINKNIVSQSVNNFYANESNMVRAQQVFLLDTGIFVPAKPEPGDGDSLLNAPFTIFHTSKHIQGKESYIDFSGL